MMRTLLVVLLLPACAAPRRPASAPAPAAGVSAPAAPPAAPPLDVEQVVGPDWPRVVPGVESRYFSSFDRRGRNSDGFSGRYSSLYRLESGEHVIFDALGPGVLRTLWFTGPEEGGEGLDLGRIRFYFDDEKRPRIETDQARLFGGKQPPFVVPLVADNRVSTGGYVSWVPLAYRGRLVVTTGKKPSFYIAQYDTYPVDTAVESWRPGRDPAALRRLFEQAQAGLSRRAFEVVPLDHSRVGRGTIEALRFTPRQRPSAERLEQARIRIFWDGEARPAVDLPLGLFFGSGLGPAPVRAAAFAMQGGVYENRLPMPFWRGFRVQVQGIAGELALALGPPRFAPGEAGQLHAVHRREHPTRAGEDFTWIDLQRAGKLVGTVLTVRPPTPETKRWWEGDLRSYADGRRTPGLHGTGHEDDHLGGWSNTFLSGPFSLPMHGEPRSELIEREGEQYNARATLYRLWPGIHFMGAIRHGVEHGNENGVQADYSGAAFLYLLPGGPRLHEADRLEPADAASAARHGFTVDGEARREELASAFEGRAYRRPVEGTVLYHRGAARFTLAVSPDNRGCYLRRTYDQQIGRQRAEVRVDGRRVGDWYTAEANKHLRWAERDYFLPARFTRGKRRLRIELRPKSDWTTGTLSLLEITGIKGRSRPNARSSATSPKPTE